MTFTDRLASSVGGAVAGMLVLTGGFKPGDIQAATVVFNPAADNAVNIADRSQSFGTATILPATEDIFPVIRFAVPVWTQAEIDKITDVMIRIKFANQPNSQFAIARANFDFSDNGPVTGPLNTTGMPAATTNLTSDGWLEYGGSATKALVIDWLRGGTNQGIFVTTNAIDTGFFSHEDAPANAAQIKVVTAETPELGALPTLLVGSLALLGLSRRREGVGAGGGRGA